MIVEIKSVSNNLVTVCMIDKPFPSIFITDKKTNEVVQAFSGFDGLEALFNEFKENINEEIDPATAISFFKTKANQL